MGCTLSLPPVQSHWLSWQHPQLSQMPFPALSVCTCFGEPRALGAPGCSPGAGSAGREGARIRAEHILSSPLLRIHSGKNCSARSQQQLETDSLESHKEERLWQGEADAPSFSRLCLSQLLGPRCLRLTEHQETSVSPQAVPEKPDIPPNDSPASTLHQRHRVGLIATARLALLPKPSSAPRGEGLEGNVLMPAGRQEQFPLAATYLLGRSCHWALRKDQQGLSPRQHRLLAWLLNNLCSGLTKPGRFLSHRQVLHTCL